MAKDADIQLLADEFGWTFADTADFIADQQVFGALADSIQENYTSSFSSAVSLEEPSDSPEVYFKGAAPPSALAEIAASGLTVTVVTYVGKNAGQWDTQVDAITDWLLSNSYTSFVVAFDDVDTIDVLIGNGDALPTLPTNIDDDVSIVGITGGVSENQGDVHGGTALSVGTSFSATWGWCVETDGGTRGLLTAGHVGPPNPANAPDPDTYTHPVSGNTESTTKRNEYIGRHGDYEWHTTTGTESPDWFADEANQLRAMHGVKRGFRRNDASCVFGKATNVRTCDLIFRSDVRLTNPENGSVNRHQVVMTNFTTASGDSGGGWSFGSTSHGVHTGGVNSFRGATRSTYSKNKRVDNAMGVDICVSP